MSNVLNVSTKKVLAPNPLGFHQSLQLPLLPTTKTSIQSSNFTVGSILIWCKYQDVIYRSKLLTTRLLIDRDMYTKNSCYPWTLHKYGRNIIT